MFYRSILFIFVLLFSYDLSARVNSFDEAHDMSSAFIRIAKSSNDITDYVNTIFDKKYLDKNIIISQDRAILMNFKNYDKEINDLFILIFKSYCDALAGKFTGGNFKVGHDFDNIYRNYTTRFVCMSDSNKKLFSSSTDGSFYNQLTYIKIDANKPESYKNLQTAVNNMKATEVKNNNLEGFYGSDGDNHVIYYQDKYELIYRFQYSDKSKVFSEKFDNLIGVFKTSSTTFKPIYNSALTDVKGSDCMIKPAGIIFAYPVTECTLTFKNVVFYDFDMKNFSSVYILSPLGKFKIYPMYKDTH